MKNRFIIIILIAFFTPLLVQAADAKPAKAPSTKKERNFIRKGNSLYEEKRFAEAEVEYKKALQENAQSEIATFNLASSLIRQSGSADPNSKNNPMQEATQLLNDVAQNAIDINLQAKAFYNLGNLAFNQEQYEQSINHYKNSLRRNPNDDKARENLRLAQKKLKEQQDQNKDQNKDKDKKDQDKQDQQKDKDKQDQNKDQNKDQDKKDQDKKDQNKDQQNQQNQDKKDQQNQQPQPQQGISKENAEQILKAMQNEEKATQQRINAEKMKEKEAERRRTQNNW